MLIMFCEILSELVLILATMSEIIVASVLALEATAISRLCKLIRLAWIFYLLLAASLLFISVKDELKPILWMLSKIFYSASLILIAFYMRLWVLASMLIMFALILSSFALMLVIAIEIASELVSIPIVFSPISSVFYLITSKFNAEKSLFRSIKSVFWFTCYSRSSMPSGEILAILIMLASILSPFCPILSEFSWILTLLAEIASSLALTLAFRSTTVPSATVSLLSRP